MKPELSQVEYTTDLIATSKFYPTTNAVVRDEVLRLLIDMVGTVDQLAWLGQQYRTISHEWRGLAGVRELFTSRFPPADHIEDNKSECRRISTSPTLALPAAPEVVTEEERAEYQEFVAGLQQRIDKRKQQDAKLSGLQSSAPYRPPDWLRNL